MNTDRIKEIQQTTAYPESVSVQQALLQVWNETKQEQLRIGAVMGWVAIDDHLPEKGDECWVHRTHGEIEMDLFDGDWWVNQTYGGVTHWQKVVKPPCP